MSDKLRDQINDLIRDEIQDVINDYVDAQEETQKAGLGFVGKDVSFALSGVVFSNKISQE